MKESPYSASLDDGLPLEQPPRKESGIWHWVIAVVLIAFFVIHSLEPAVELRSDPPPEFLGTMDYQGAQGGQEERSLAEAYWQVAVRRIQGAYSTSKPLPVLPPVQFQIAGQNTTSLASRDSRMYYWQQLRKVWGMPESWVDSYQWSTEWLGPNVNGAIHSAVAWVANFLETLGLYPSMHHDPFPS
jgi:hypothetical protein